MRPIWRSGVLAAALLVAGAQAAPTHPQEEVKALVERAARYIADHGRAQAFADFSRPDGGFVSGDLYIFCNDSTGLVLAHGGNPKLTGKRVTDLRDPAGHLPWADIFRVARQERNGWVEYLWPNPAVGRIERKINYVMLIDQQTVCGSGYFEPDPS